MVYPKRNADIAGPSNVKRMATGPSTKMKVYVRVRPYNDKEIQGDFRNVVKLLDERVMVFDPKESDQAFFFHGVKQKMRDITKKQNKEMQFIFDAVYGEYSTNEDVYNGSIKDLLPSLLDGYNCSVFVYGATGAGKTYTMIGNSESPGITYLTMLNLYSQMHELQDSKKFELRISYLEVYNENVHDLLNPGSGALHLREDPVNGVIVANMKLEIVSSAEHLLSLLQRGNANRTQHPTDANAESSRSHAVFQVFIKMQSKDSEEVKLVKLTMIDLAGSERGAATHCRGLRFKEGSNINKSLLALGNCINNLADGVRHIPYRDSKLTRLLKDSLGGNCQTVMIACVGPTTLSYEDTYNTLKYATRAKNIKTVLTKHVLSIDNHVDHYKELVTDLQSKVSTLQSGLDHYKQLAQDLQSKSHIMPDLTAWNERIKACFDEKKLLHLEILTLESKEKMLIHRIQNKNTIANRLEMCDDEEDGETKNLVRIGNSVQQLEGRILGLRGKISEIWKRKIENTERIAALQADMVKHGVYNFLENTVARKEAEIEVLEMTKQKEHIEQLYNWACMDTDKKEVIIQKLMEQNAHYYSLLRGYNKMTDTMKEEHSAVKNVVKGNRNVTWAISPNNRIKKRRDMTETYSTLCIENLRENRKPEFLDELHVVEEFKIPSSEDTEEDEYDENTTVTLETHSGVNFASPTVLKRFTPRATPMKEKVHGKQKIKINAVPGKRLAPLQNLTKPTFQAPKRRCVQNNR